MSEPRTYKPRSEAELRIALAKVLKHQHTLHVPVRETDEDVVLGDGIKELVHLRQRIAALERQAQAWRRMEQA